MFVHYRVVRACSVLDKVLGQVYRRANLGRVLDPFSRLLYIVIPSLSVIDCDHNERCKGKKTSGVVRHSLHQEIWRDILERIVVVP